MEKYIRSLRRAGAPVNVIAAVVKPHNRTLLSSNGGHIELTAVTQSSKGWVLFSTKLQKRLSRNQTLKKEYLKGAVKDVKIPLELV